MGNKNCRLHTQDRDKTPENLSVSCLPAASFYFIVRRVFGLESWSEGSLQGKMGRSGLQSLTSINQLHPPQ